jgi:type I restriction enzyme, S subunit
VTEGWNRAPLVDFAELVSTGPFGSMLHKSDYVSHGVPLVNPTNIADESIVPDLKKQVGADALTRLASYVLKVGDVVVGRRGEIGRCAVVQPEQAGWVCGTGCFFIRPRPALDSRFLAQLLRSPHYRGHLEKASTGATMQNMSNSTLAQLPLAVPPPGEQRRIVAILDEAFEGIATAKANAEKNLQNARELFTAHLRSVFASQGALVPLSACATDISDGDHAPPPKSPSGIPFITISNVDKETRRIDFSDTFTVSRAYFDRLKPQRKPRRGDVLYTVTGSFGIPILVEDDGEFCFQRHIGLIRPTRDVDSRWLTYALLSPQVREQAEAGATGTAQRTVSLGVLRGITIPKVGIPDQLAIAAQLDAMSDAVQRMKEIAQARIRALDDLKTSLLHQAFNGSL